MPDRDSFEQLRAMAEADGLHVEKMERASDRFVALGTELGLTREEMASVCLTMAVNHLIASKVPRHRATLAIAAMYDYRAIRPIHESVLVPRSVSDAASKQGAS